MAAGADAGEVVGSIFGSLLSKGDRDKAQAEIEGQKQALEALGVPPDLSGPLAIKYLQQQGTLSPEMVEAVDVKNSEFANIKSDPALKKDQMDALASLKERGRVGLTSEDRAGMARILNAQQREGEAKRQQILQQFAQRGQLGSGGELAAQLQGQQASDQDAYLRSLDLAGQASRNALQAMQQSGQLAGQISDQDYGRQRDAASAQDVINRFAAQNLQGVRSQNTQARNSAQAGNLNAAQSVSNQNAGMYNQELERQNEARRQFFQDRLGLQAAKAGVSDKLAGVHNANAARTAAIARGVGKTVGAGIEAYATGGASAAMPSGGSSYNGQDVDELPDVQQGPKRFSGY